MVPSGSSSSGRPPTPSGNGAGAGQGRPSSEISLDSAAQPTSSSRKGKARQTVSRNPSMTSNASDDDAPVAYGSRRSRSRSRGPTECIPPPSSETEIWTRYGVQNGEPVFMRQHHTSSTKDKDCVTYYWKCFSRTPLAEPPELGERPDLAIGDLFYNQIMGVDAPRLWVCTAIQDGRAVWNTISEGHLREDGRRLYVTFKKKQPSWVLSDWGVRQIPLKQQRSGTVPAKFGSRNN
ncbi:hypothetical protein GY45DRAFT_1374550 [Cubamyces sp. BRFM 1775]|nr:hypothetical protein GY45DRAFT_1374550 [Cubamyces sp. BRFM 1775]